MNITQFLIIVQFQISIACTASCLSRALFSGQYSYDYRKDYNEGFTTVCLPKEQAKIVEEKEYTSVEKSIACFNHMAWCDFPPTIGLYDYNITCYQTDAHFVIHQYNCALFEIRTRDYWWPWIRSCTILDVICNRKINAFVSIGDSIVKLLNIDVGGITEGIKTTTDSSINQYVSTLSDNNGITTEESVAITEESVVHIAWIINTVLLIIIALGLLFSIIQCIRKNRWRTYHISNNSVQYNRQNQSINLN